MDVVILLAVYEDIADPFFFSAVDSTFLCHIWQYNTKLFEVFSIALFLV